MPKHGKKFNAANEKVELTKLHTIDEALKIIVENPCAKFDETIDFAVRLGVNPRHADQMVRGACALPHGTGKTLKVAVFAKGEKAKEAEAAGADFVGAEDLVAKISEGWLDFDKAVATPDMMGQVGRIAKILGPRKMMPNPKSGTVTMDVTKAITEMKAGKIDFRVDKSGIIHAPVGKHSFGAEKLRENIATLVDQIIKLKPASAKGTYMKSINISSTMGPGLKLDASQYL